MAKTTGLQRLRDAYVMGRGVKLSAAHVQQIWQHDDALHTRVANEDAGEDVIPPHTRDHDGHDSD